MGRRVLVGLSVLFVWSGLSLAHAFTSGSTGALGIFNPPTQVPPGTTVNGSTVTVPLPVDGVLHFTTVTVNSGVTVDFASNARNTPVTLLATGDMTITGIVSVTGKSGGQSSTTGLLRNVGGVGGPGAFTGGNGQSREQGILASAGQGPGGGAPGSFNPSGSANGTSATYGAGVSFESLIPLLGGSGGGGGGAWLSAGASTPTSGGGGGGGGGAIVIASSTLITISGRVEANGGTGGSTTSWGGGGGSGGGGSGGAIRLVAPVLAGSGIIQALGGTQTCGTAGAAGRIRLDVPSTGQQFTGSFTPAASSSGNVGPVITTSDPALGQLPTVTISSVGGVVVPLLPAGSYVTADLALPTRTTTPVPVVLTATNTPLTTTFTIKLVPALGSATLFTASAPTGTPTQSTVTANVTFPTGQVSVLNAYASLTLTPLTAQLFPTLDGEDVEQVMMVAGLGRPSATMLMTRSGRAVPVSALSQEDQVKVVAAFEALRADRSETTGAHE
ncbi:MAG: hypothetical protein U0236_12045 [Nitrospira sp.]